ncbi:SusC/RagA family TonB-linked outer membrane protein [Hymenobacter busanensis]|uniref:SusC/RagA family TonB-linked outer membrane protein n=1 Tax=Hymenobacter busanensis TaxID=2607656 RepID=A0A7L4ZV73_9BACT|nr:SusC/RagA family TonB-linked outer membrane protein [Hymenobacter busanensis]KAA9339520.1 SusC/RagA family TonB-linked outer membrane protein [Hymenobacter busanensis]QHJ06725.1 SusC/RagA family TonB-linked outer membrane protein [Hymenobacter busanensis]
MPHSLHAPFTLRATTRLAYVPLVGFLISTGPVQAATAGAWADAPHPAAPVSVNVNVTGTVKDAKGNAIPGVTVVLKGTTTGTTTDAEGVFRINLPTGNETLVFSSVGYKKVEVPVAGRTNLDIALDDETSALNEVVVVGYGTLPKASLTGAVAVVDMKAIQELPVGSLSTAIQGQLPGVSVSGGTGRPGDPGHITVRNPKIFSKDGGTEYPLFVIDNVVRTEEDFNLLDQSEVESISILKDAAAAIYGARSNQGVVMVATKRGKAGPPKLSYSGSVGSSDAVRLPTMMTGEQHAIYMNDYNMGRGGKVTDAAYYTPDEIEHFRNNNFNWLEEAWKPAIVTRHAFNVSGGSDRATYFAGVSYNYQNANFDNINSNKWTFRASTDVNVARGLKAGLSLSGDLAQKRMYFLKQGGENPENDMRSLLLTPQFSTPYIDGKPVLLNPISNPSNNFDAFHFFEVQNSDNFTSTRNTGLNINATLEYELPFVKGLKARMLYSKTMDNSFGKQYGTKITVYRYSMLGEHKHIYGGDILGTAVLDNGDRVRINPNYTDSYQWNGYLTYERTFGKHQVSAIALFEQSETHYDDVAAFAGGAIVGGLPNMRYTVGTQTTSESESESGTLSYAGRFNYNYANKYLLEGSLRYDASTNFAPEYRWGAFPSVSAGWVMSEESFFHDNVAAVDFLKIRGSVGLLGGDATRAYNWQSNYNLQGGKGAVFNGNNDKGLIFSPNNTMANRQARWDENTKFNAGIDAQFLNNKLSLSADGFYDKRRNMLTALTSSVSQLIGATLPSENFSSLDAFGYEISLGYADHITDDWSYRLNTFFSWSDNKQLKVDVEKGKIGTWEDPTGRSTDMGVQGYRYLGMFRSQPEVDQWLESHKGYTIMGEVPKAGMLYYEDIRGPKDANGNFTAPDGKITDVDQEFLTKKASNHYGFGFNPSMSFRGLTISMTMGLSWGGQAMVESAARKQATATSNRPAFWADHWSAENQGAKYPSPSYPSTYDLASAFWFRSSVSAGMRNANVSYTLSENTAQRLGMGSVKVFFVAVNPINFYNPYDYKTFSGGFDSYPTLRSLSLGLNVGF